MLRLYPSDPLYDAWDWLLTIRAAALNPACHMDVARVPEPERRALLAALDEAMYEAWWELTR